MVTVKKDPGKGRMPGNLHYLAFIMKKLFTCYLRFFV